MKIHYRLHYFLLGSLLMLGYLVLEKLYTRQVHPEEPLLAGCIEMIWTRSATGIEVATVYYYTEFDEATEQMPKILGWLGHKPEMVGKRPNDPVISVRKFRCAREK